MTRFTRFGGLALAGWLAVAVASELQAATDAAETDSAIDVEIQRGDQLAGNHEFVKARKAYRKAAKLEREADRVPELSLRRIANTYYVDKDLRVAADVLDDLAEEAARRGDLVVQAWATADAAWLHGRMGNERGVRTRVDRLTRLLIAPGMPEADRERIISTRLSGGDVLALIS